VLSFPARTHARAAQSTGIWLDFLLKEWLLLGSALGLGASSVYLRRFPTYSAAEWEVLFLLWTLFVAVRSLEANGIILRLSQSFERGRLIPLKLVAATFVLSMVVTNDVALIVVVPLTLSLNTDRKDTLVILEAFAANAGSALTPVGNPQNLYIYWFYGLGARDFVTAIAPFSLCFLAVLLVAALLVRPANAAGAAVQPPVIRPAAYAGGPLLAIAVLTILRLLPLASATLVSIYASLFDRKALRVDYGLLGAFFCFFGLSENLRSILGTELEHAGHTFLLSALASQVMSNVPAALLFAKFTSHWKALLWGVNVGGFGSLVASFANLISYKLYINHERRANMASFTLRFVGFGFAMLLAGMGLYWAVAAGPQ